MLPRNPEGGDKVSPKSEIWPEMTDLLPYRDPKNKDKWPSLGEEKLLKLGTQRNSLPRINIRGFRIFDRETLEPVDLHDIARRRNVLCVALMRKASAQLPVPSDRLRPLSPEERLATDQAGFLTDPKFVRFHFVPTEFSVGFDVNFQNHIWVTTAYADYKVLTPAADYKDYWKHTVDLVELHGHVRDCIHDLGANENDWAAGVLLQKAVDKFNANRKSLEPISLRAGALLLRKYSSAAQAHARNAEEYASRMAIRRGLDRSRVQPLFEALIEGLFRYRISLLERAARELVVTLPKAALLSTPLISELGGQQALQTDAAAVEMMVDEFLDPEPEPVDVEGDAGEEGAEGGDAAEPDTPLTDAEAPPDLAVQFKRLLAEGTEDDPTWTCPLCAVMHVSEPFVADIPPRGQPREQIVNWVVMPHLQHHYKTIVPDLVAQTQAERYPSMPL